MYSRSCGMESCTHILQFALLCVDLLGRLVTAYDRLLVTCSTSRDHKLDEARHWRVERRNYFRYNFQVVLQNIILVFKLLT